MDHEFDTDTPARIRIAGYVDITTQEFQTHYKPTLDKCIDRGDTYVLSDEAGLCQIALEYLISHDVPAASITVFCSRLRSGNLHPMTCSLAAHHIETIAGGQTERYEAMLDASDDKLIWLRAADGFEEISGSDAIDMRFSGPREAKRVQCSRYVQAAMDYYDTIV